MRDYAARANAYALGVVSGEILVSEITKLACQRHVDDIKRAEQTPADFPYIFSVEAANRVCGFIELFPHIKGEWAAYRQKIRLEDWQCFILCSVFGWLDAETGYRRFRTVYIEVPRKNAKTTLSAPVALYMLTADGEQGAEVCSAATKKDQARISWGLAHSMVRKTEAFRTEFSVIARALSLVCMETDSTFIPIDSQGKTQDGANLHMSLNDELHAWKGRELYAVLETAMGSRRQPLMWNITTAGKDQAGICYEQRLYLIKVLQGIFKDESYFGIIYTIDKDDDIFAEETHKKANPNYGVSVFPHNFTADAAKARNNPASRNDFKMKRLNCWTHTGDPFFDLAAWDACQVEGLSIDDFEGEPCVVGIDLAQKKDVNAICLLFERGHKIFLFFYFFLPETAVQEGATPAYAGWVEEGFIEVHEGNAADFNRITRFVVDELAPRFAISNIGIDPWQAAHMGSIFQDEGLEPVNVTQNAPSLTVPMKEFFSRMDKGLIGHDGNPVARWMISNVMAKKDAKENVFPRKESPNSMIDGVVAALIAGAVYLNGGLTETLVEGNLVGA